jgi:signal recognition particle subunit SRP54
MGKLGSFSKLLSFIPGVSNMKLPTDKLNLQEESIKKFKHLMDSMTLAELEEPKVLNKSRIERIAKGSGCTVGDVRQLIKQYNQMKNMMKKMRGGNLKKMMKQLGIKDLDALEGMMG